MNDSPNTPLLEVRDLRINYSVRNTLAEAVRGASFSVAAGETVALVGQSGSGKSTLATAAQGLLPHNAEIVGGDILYRGRSIPALGSRALRDIRGAEIGLVPQDPVASLNAVRTIGAQLAEPIRVQGERDQGRLLRRVVDALGSVGIRDPEHVATLYPHELSGGMLQRVLIAGAISLGPKLLIADEPTSALDVSVQKRILDLIATLQRDQGFGVLLITHDLAVASERADRVVVLRDGLVEETGPALGVFSRPQATYTRQLLDDAPAFATREARPALSTDTALELRDITKTYPSRRRGAPKIVLDAVSLTVQRGSTHALVGESGSGKSTLARVITRLVAQDSGVVEVAGAAVTETRHSRLREVRRTLQLVYQNPFTSLDPRQTVESIVREPLDLYRVGIAADRTRRARELLDSVAIAEHLFDHRVSELSGGQRQRVAIARALALNPEVLVLDEPTSSLDVTVQAQVLRLLVDLQRELGLTYVFITHDLAIVRAIADTVTVLQNGVVVEGGTVEQVFGNPTSAYTRELIDAAPHIPNPERELQPAEL